MIIVTENYVLDSNKIGVNLSNNSIEGFLYSDTATVFTLAEYKTSVEAKKSFNRYVEFLTQEAIYFDFRTVGV